MLNNGVYITDLEKWLGIEFETAGANPLYNGNNLYLNNTLVTSLVIPDTVTEIKAFAFYFCTSITSVTIPNSVEKIGTNAFNNCVGLTKVNITDIAAWCGIVFGSTSANPLYHAHNLYLNNTLVTSLEIPNTVTEIKAYAFYTCISITSVTMPDSVETIGNFAFNGCTGLTRVNITDIKKWCGIAFGTGSANPLNSAKNLYLNDTLVTSLVIPNTVTEINAYAFYGCTSITSATIPASVVTIGAQAFSVCTSLSNFYCEAFSQPAG